MQYAFEWLGHQDPKLPCLEGKMESKKQYLFLSATGESETFVA